MEAWIGSEHGQIEMHLTNKFREVNVVPIDTAFEHANPMSPNMRASLRLTYAQASVVGAGDVVVSGENIVLEANPYVKAV